MGLPSFSVKRPVTVTMIFSAIVLLGTVALFRLPVELMPNSSFSQISIITYVRGGMSPADIEELVTKPVESAISSVAHLENLLSVSKEGECTVVLNFKVGTNMDYATLEAREKLSSIKRDLPREAEKPVLAQFEQNDVPIVNLSVTSTRFTTEKLRSIVSETMIDPLKRVNGVANVEVGGGKPRKITVDIDMVRMVSHGLSIQKIVSAITASNVSFVTGDLETEDKKLSLRLIGVFKTVEEIKDIPVLQNPVGSVIKLRDVATIKDSYLEAKEYARVNIKPVINIYIQKENTANTITVAEDVVEAVEAAKLLLPKGVNVYITTNHAIFIKEAIETVTKSLWQGGLLAMIVLYLFLRDKKPTLIIALSIPTSVMVTFFLMNRFEITLNVMTLSGLALGIGMLVDNAIVVLENIDKKKHEGASEVDASVRGSEEVALAIFASTLTTVIVFLPIAFVSAHMKQLYGGLALTVSFSLFASLFVALSLVPMMASRPVKGKKENVLTEGDVKKEKKYDLLNKIKTRYKRLLGLSVRYRGRLFLICFILIGIAVFLYTKIGKEFLGSTEQDKFTIFIELPTGAKLDESDKAVRRIEKILREIPEVKLITSRVEGWSSKIYVQLVPSVQRKRSATNIIEYLRPKVSKIPHAFVHFSEEQAVGTKEMIIEIYGYSYETLREIATAYATRMGSLPGLSDTKIRMREGRPELGLVVDKERAMLLGIGPGIIADEVHGLMRGFKASKYRTKGQSIEIVVRLDESYRKTFKDLHKLPLPGPNNQTLYLDQVTNFEFGLGPSEVWRKNKNRMVQVSATLGKVSLGDAIEKVRKAVSDIQLPEDYFFRFGGDYEKLLDSQRQFKFIVILVLILIYLVLASLFESFYQPLIIMISVPLALVGAMIALYITNKKIGVGVMIGLMMLAGIVVNNAIILIDHINHLVRERNFNILKAAIRSGAERLRPIFMTAETTILGLLPMAMDSSGASNLWSPISITVIGGLLISTFLTLIVVPCVYVTFSQIGEFFAGFSLIKTIQYYYKKYLYKRWRVRT